MPNGVVIRESVGVRGLTPTYGSAGDFFASFNHTDDGIRMGVQVGLGAAMPNGVVVRESVGVRKLTPTYIPSHNGSCGLNLDERAGLAERSR